MLEVEIESINFKSFWTKSFRGIGEPKYMPIHTWEALNKILTDALRNYNELNAAMDLVGDGALVSRCLND